MNPVKFLALFFILVNLVSKADATGIFDTSDLEVVEGPYGSYVYVCLKDEEGEPYERAVAQFGVAESWELTSILTEVNGALQSAGALERAGYGEGLIYFNDAGWRRSDKDPSRLPEFILYGASLSEMLEHQKANTTRNFDPVEDKGAKLTPEAVEGVSLTSEDINKRDQMLEYIEFINTLLGRSMKNHVEVISVDEHPEVKGFSFLKVYISNDTSSAVYRARFHRNTMDQFYLISETADLNTTESFSRLQEQSLQALIKKMEELGGYDDVKISEPEGSLASSSLLRFETYTGIGGAVYEIEVAESGKDDADYLIRISLEDIVDR